MATLTIDFIFFRNLADDMSLNSLWSLFSENFLFGFCVSSCVSFRRNHTLFRLTRFLVFRTEFLHTFSESLVNFLVTLSISCSIVFTCFGSLNLMVIFSHFAGFLKLEITRKFFTILHPLVDDQRTELSWVK